MSEQVSQSLPNLGSVSESYAAGVASANASLALPETAWGLTIAVQASASLDAKKLIGYLAAKAGGPVPAEVASFIEAALAAT